MSAAISLRNLENNLGTQKVLDQVSFDVAQGEIVALLGTSGCGKSTLLTWWQDCSKRVKASSGSTAIGARGRRTAMRSRICSRKTACCPGAPRVRMPSSALTQRAPRFPLTNAVHARTILDLVALQGFADAHPHQLSGGLRSRVALARSLVTGPRILLMDEPFSKLDPQMRSQMHDELLRIHAMQRMTVLFVTHDVEEAIVLADRVVVLAPRPGRVREIVDVDLPRPRAATDPTVAETIRQLRLLISPMSTVPRSSFASTVAQRVVLVVLLLVAWWVASLRMPQFVLPGPLRVAHALVGLVQNSTFFDDLGITLYRVVAGFLLAAAVGAPLGIALGSNPRVAHFFEPLLSIVNTVSLSVGEVKAFALEHAPAYQHPRQVWFVDAFPFASTNKIDRAVLKREAARRLADEGRSGKPEG